MRFQDGLDCRDNNFGLLRLTAAAMVVLSHSYHLSGHPAGEPGIRLTGTFTLGSFAVFIFFTISGFLISKSWTDSRSLAGYTTKRAARILPGLTAAILLAVLVVGPLTTRLSWHDYFTHPLTWSHLRHNLILHPVVYVLPGVFESNPYPHAVNGSLWSLPVEMYMYVFVPLLWAVGRMLGRHRSGALLLLAAALVGCYWHFLAGPEHAGTVVFNLAMQSSMLCVIHFLFGALFYVYRAAIPRSPLLAAAATVLFVSSWHTPVCGVVENFTVPCLILWSAFAKIPGVDRFDRLGDASYGCYIYAFPIQQWIVLLCPGISPTALFLVAMTAVLPLSYASWHLLEKRVLRLARGQRPVGGVKGTTGPQMRCVSRTLPAEPRPDVDVLVVAYNSRRWLPGLLESLSRTAYDTEKLRLIVVDNGSSDESVAYLHAAASQLPFRLDIVETGTNGGFTGGYRVAMEHATAPYWFVLNPDTRVTPQAIPRLVDVLDADPRAGIAEARQRPREHPKYFDPFTRETNWCSGACMMLRQEAVAEVGGGFDSSFFLYAEDVDLSWRMWLHGWKCLYVREAAVEHFTEDLDPRKEPRTQHFYSMRNGALMRVIYGTPAEAVLHYLAMLRLGLVSRSPAWHKWGTLTALAASLPMLPGAIRKRVALRRLGSHPWVQFNGWEYGRHLCDIALADSPAAAAVPEGSPPLLDFHAFQQAAMADAEQTDRPNLDLAPAAVQPSGSKPAILMHRTAETFVRVPLPRGGVLHGALGMPSSAGWIRGVFVVEQDDRIVYQREICQANPDHRDWMPFAAELTPSEPNATSTVILRFCSQGGVTRGYWADLAIHEKDIASQSIHRLPVAGPAISVVIPTHNRAEGIGRVVGRLLAQDFPAEAFEIVLVDSRSGDRTPEVLAELSADPRVRIFRCDKPGAAAARNMGLDNARAGLLVLMDDDILVRRDFLAQIWEAHQRTPQRVLLTRITTSLEGLADPFFRYLVQAQEVNIYNFPDPDDVPADYFYTGCIALPRSVLGQTRFDEGFTVYGVEDIDFGIQLLRFGVRMVFLGHVEVWHDYYPAFPYFCRKKGLAGYSLGYMLRKKPWLSDRFRFSSWYEKRHGLLKLLVALATPAARLAEILERIRYRPGPLNRFLYRWYRVAIRTSMFAGYRQYHQQDEMPLATPQEREVREKAA